MIFCVTLFGRREYPPDLYGRHTLMLAYMLTLATCSGRVAQSSAFGVIPCLEKTEK